jgi:hypothetical protein
MQTNYLPLLYFRYIFLLGTLTAELTKKLSPAPQANLMHDACAYRRMRMTRRQRVTARWPPDSHERITNSNGLLGRVPGPSLRLLHCICALTKSSKGSQRRSSDWIRGIRLRWAVAVQLSVPVSVRLSVLAWVQLSAPVSVRLSVRAWVRLSVPVSVRAWVQLSVLVSVRAWVQLSVLVSVQQWALVWVQLSVQLSALVLVQLSVQVRPNPPASRHGRQTRSRDRHAAQVPTAVPVSRWHLSGLRR